jgi:hypothetical protein
MPSSAEGSSENDEEAATRSPGHTRSRGRGTLPRTAAEEAEVQNNLHGAGGASTTMEKLPTDKPQMRRKLCNAWAWFHECQHNAEPMHKNCAHECTMVKQGMLDTLRVEGGIPLAFDMFSVLQMGTFDGKITRAFCAVFDRGASTATHWAFRRAHPTPPTMIPRDSGLLLDKLVTIACHSYPPGTPPKIVQSRAGGRLSVSETPSWARSSPILERVHLYALALTAHNQYWRVQLVAVLLVLVMTFALGCRVCGRLGGASQRSGGGKGRASGAATARKKKS